jgi:hypothetical protein
MQAAFITAIGCSPSGGHAAVLYGRQSSTIIFGKCPDACMIVWNSSNIRELAILAVTV